MEQIPIPLGGTPSYDEENFVITGSNQLAYEALHQWPQWPTLGTIVVGPSFSGKTHLAYLWAKLSQATFLTEEILQQLPNTMSIEPGTCWVIDGIESLLERHQKTLFHLFNLIKENQGFLLITAHTAPKQWPLTLKDLASRLMSLPVVEIKEPDDTLFMAILMKGFSDHQLKIDPKVLDFITTHVDRSFTMAKRIVEDLNAITLQQRLPLTIPVAKRVLGI